MSKFVPKRPNLESDRKQAKSLLGAVRASEPEAVRRFENHHPKRVPEAPVLADALLVVAREYGFPSWPAWKAFAEARGLDRERQIAVVLAAVCSNDIARARSLLAADPDLAREDFHLACACGEFDVVERRLRDDPELATRAGGALGWDPIQYACFSRWLRCDPVRTGGIVRIAERLLALGASPNAFHTTIWMDEPWKETVLFAAAGIANHAGLTRMLLDAGADVNDGLPPPNPGDPKASSWGSETLYHCAEFSDTRCLRLLLEAKPHALCVSYCLGRALDFENPDAARLFLTHGADPNFRMPQFENRTHFHRAVESGRSLAIVRALLDAGADPLLADDRGLTPYRSAVRYGRWDVMRLLESRGASEATEQDRALGGVFSGEFPAASGLPIHPDLLCAAARRNDVPAIHRLLEAGADIDACDAGPYGTPPLHWAAWRGRFEAVSALVERGADIHRVNIYGGAALGTAIHGSVNCFDLEGGPAMRLLEEAVQGDYPRIVECLIAAGARLPDRIEGGSEDVREILRRHGVPDSE